MAKKKKNVEPQYLMSAINNPVLNYNVYRMNHGEKLLFSIGVLIAGGIVGFIFYGGLFKEDGVSTMATHISNGVVFLVFGLVALKMFLPAITEMLRKRRLETLKNQFRDFLNSLANSLSSGMNVNDSLINAHGDMVAQFTEDSFIAKEVKEMISGVQNNIPIEKMLADFGKRSGVEDISNFSIVFETAYRTGGNLKTIIRRTSDIISGKMIIASEIETKITSNKTQMNVMLVIPVGMMIMLRLMSSEFAESFSSVIGVICVTISIGFFIAAYKVGRKIMDIKG